jgi:hypothetical protein
MGQVAERDALLPATRAALFERVCALLWPEHDPDRQDVGLGKITEDQALSAGGAIMAGLLLAGGEAVSLAGPGQIQDGDVRLAGLEMLPAAGAARSIFSSKLFCSVGVDRAKPIHRVIAEFLGARWLAQQAKMSRSQRRLLRQLQGSGAVPASVRGLHAWISFHSSVMAKAVIAADPLGVLRYGETACLTSDQADCMFEALQTLAETDPFFRGQDWDSHSAAGLMKPNLRAKITNAIASGNSNSHLRSLLIEGLKDTPLAGDLANTLEEVMFSTERFYRERRDAAEALMPHRSRSMWQRAIEILCNQGTEDSTRLARNLIEEIDCDVTDELLVATLLAELGVTICPLPPLDAKRVITLRHYRRIVEALPGARLISLLNLFSEYAVLVGHADWSIKSDLSELMSLMFLRAIDERIVLPEDAAQAWKWLGALARSEASNRDAVRCLQARLDAEDSLRHAIQHHVLYKERPKSTIWMSELDLCERMVGLAERPRDVSWLLEQYVDSDNMNPALRRDWCDLVQLAGSRGLDPYVRSVCCKFQRGDQQLEAVVRRIQHPKVPAWERKEERRKAKRERKARIANEMNRRFYDANRARLRTG